jgi:diguanylate cyclase (GGDEF)-like protein
MLQARHGVELHRTLARAAEFAREGRAAEVRALADALDRGDLPIGLDDRVLLGTLLGLAHANAQAFAEARVALDAVLPLVPAAGAVRQARFHAIAAWTAQGLGDDEVAMDEIVRALALVDGLSVDGQSVSTGEDLRATLGNCSVVLGLLQLFPLAAETAERSIAVAAEQGLAVNWSEFQVGFVYFTWALRLDHLGLAEHSSQQWAQARTHFTSALASSGLSALFRGWATAWLALCSARLGDIEQGHLDLARARTLPVRPPNPAVRDSIDLAAGALLLAEGRIYAAESTLSALWDRLGTRGRSPFVEEVASLLGRAAAARGDGTAALRWFREMHERYGRAQYGAWLARATAARLRIEQEALLRRTRELESDALSDPLTGVPNRRAFDVNLAQLVAAAHATGTPLTLAIVDVDRFKRVNDTFGHPAGDEVLRRVARIIRSHSRAADRCARYGGDELTLCLPVAAAEAAVVLDRISRMIADQPWSAVAAGLSVTVSVGLAELAPGDTATSLFWAADRCLLAAKRARPPVAAGS